MIKRACPILFLLIFAIADIAHGQQPVRVVILPFEVYAQEDLSYLKQQIPEVIKTQLAQEGARILILDQETLASSGLRADSPAAIHQIGVETGGSYVIWRERQLGHKPADMAVVGPAIE